ncbi:hypothetical protein OFB92_33240, partial [Escherichia coli]|nr:hypothetical protein [Escherichia coli]
EPFCQIIPKRDRKSGYGRANFPNARRNIRSAAEEWRELYIEPYSIKDSSLTATKTLTPALSFI